MGNLVCSAVCSTAGKEWHECELGLSSGQMFHAVDWRAEFVKRVGVVAGVVWTSGRSTGEELAAIKF